MRLSNCQIWTYSDINRFLTEVAGGIEGFKSQALEGGEELILSFLALRAFSKSQIFSQG